jgi:hypothetical protein
MGKKTIIVIFFILNLMGVVDFKLYSNAVEINFYFEYLISIIGGK